MKRREFLKRAVPAATVPLLISGYSLTAYGRSPFLEALVSSATETDRVLVLIQLNGGNDGLNTVIPLDQYSALAAARSNILIDEKKVLPLSSSTGLHPAMTGMQSLYGDGKLVIVQGVSYPNPNFSHFRATDIWLTGADSNQVLSSGWMGRYLDQEFPGFPAGYPSTAMPHPLAIQIGSVVSPGLNGPKELLGMAITNPNSTYILPGGSDTPPNTPAGHELTFIRQIAQLTQQYGTVIKTAAGNVTNKSSLYPSPGRNSLADQLKIVAQLVAGGLKTRIYVVNIGGFDTHSAQVSGTGGTETGAHANLLDRLSTAITAFQDDLRLLGVEKRVIGMTFSEFGRRIKSNASLGTDHGTAAPVFVFGLGVTGSIIGTSPALPPQATVSDNVPMQYDFRSVYASVLQDWFGASQSELQAVLNNHTQTLPIVLPAAARQQDFSVAADYELYQNFPNPFNPSTVIRYTLLRPEQVTVEVFDMTGQRVKLLVQAEQSDGRHQVVFDGTGVASGTYFYRIRAGDFVATKKMLLLK